MVNADNCVKLYSVGIDHTASGMYNVANEESAIIEYYTVEGVKVDSPVSSGIYVVRRADGTSSKILIK